ncbi:MAG: transposase [bacterium]|nr:transposase [bacterium]
MCASERKIFYAQRKSEEEHDGSEPECESADQVGKAAHRKYSAEDKIRVVLAGLRGEQTVAALCRQENLHQNIYYTWLKEFMEAGGQAVWRRDTRRKPRRCEQDATGERSTTAGGGRPDRGSTRAQKKSLLKLPKERERYQRMSAQQKEEVIRLVERSQLSVNQTLRKLGVPTRTYIVGCRTARWKMNVPWPDASGTDCSAGRRDGYRAPLAYPDRSAGSFFSDYG